MKVLVREMGYLTNGEETSEQSDTDRWITFRLDMFSYIGPQDYPCG